MKTSYESLGGLVELAHATRYHNSNFGYTLFEDVIDPKDPGGVNVFAIHVPANSITRIWEYVEPEYQETVELLSGTAHLLVLKTNANDWVSVSLRNEDPTGSNLTLSCGDLYCLVTGDDEAVMLSRPSKEFDISFERVAADHPADLLAQYTC